MADDKKKEKPAGWNFDPIEGIFVFLFFAALLGAIVPAIWNYITSGEISFYGFKLSGVLDFFKSNVLFFQALGFVLAGGAAIGTFVFTKKADAIWREMKAQMYPNPKDMKISSQVELTKNPMVTRWEKIIKLSESENGSDWRLSIIEADIILDELLEKLKLPGDTMGEKLKAVEKSDFTTIESAWEAHKMRNSIAHEGGDFLVSQREIRRIISLYEAVFKEFYLI
jgi:hypothetical protein